MNAPLTRQMLRRANMHLTVFLIQATHEGNKNLSKISNLRIPAKNYKCTSPQLIRGFGPPELLIFKLSDVFTIFFTSGIFFNTSRNYGSVRRSWHFQIVTSIMRIFIKFANFASRQNNTQDIKNKFQLTRRFRFPHVVNCHRNFMK